MRELTEIKDELKYLLETIYGAEDIEDNSSFKNDFGMDSLDVIEFWIHIERKFDITTDELVTEEIDTLAEAAAYLYGRI